MEAALPVLTWDQGKLDFHRKLGNFVQYFQVNLPTNDYGVPLQLVSPMVIAENMHNCVTTDDLSDEALDKAIMQVDFDESIPLVEGLPLWDRLDGEVYEYFKLFKEYREMLYTHGTRSISKLANEMGLKPKTLNTLAKSYHWQLRCRAYDLHMEIEAQRKRNFETKKMLGKHKQAADKLMEQALDYLEHHPEQLDPKTALQMLQTAMKAGRLSLGLNADKPGSTDSTGTNIHISQNAGSSSERKSSRVEVNSQDNQGENSVQMDKDELRSILHILDASGALDKAKQEVILDAEYSDIEDESEAVEGI